MKHHAHTNDPEKDPDYFHTHVDHWWQAAINVHGQTDGGNSRLQKMIESYMEEDENFKSDIEKGTVFTFVFFLLQMVIAFYFPLETLLLWWLPKKACYNIFGSNFLS